VYLDMKVIKGLESLVKRFHYDHFPSHSPAYAPCYHSHPLLHIHLILYISAHCTCSWHTIGMIKQISRQLIHLKPAISQLKPQFQFRFTKPYLWFRLPRQHCQYAWHTPVYGALWQAACTLDAVAL